jgi:peroxiredoxin
MKDQDQSLFQNFANICQNGQMRAEIKTLTMRWSNLAKGEKAPSIRGQDRNGKVINLDDHRGKFVYLNFWASWCQPCTSDYHSLVALSNQFDQNEIVLMAASVDEDIGLWTKVVEQRAPGRILDMRISADQLQKVKADYLLNSLPVHVLIDPDGRIIDARAPSPSDPALLRLLASYALALHSEH